MRHLIAFRKFNRHPNHRRSMLRNLVTAIVKHGKIKTTVPKAKDLRRLAERMVTYAKRGTDGAKRKASQMIFEPAVLQKLMAEMPKRFKDVTGGYTRIIRLGKRGGDRADMCYVGYIDVLPARKPMERSWRDNVAAAAQANIPRLPPL